ncbi:MAG: replication initiation factor domain-containing protein [Firmicutes bacterium]|nr:replication initiation factor domain-containing protein [Bacillota bacterium]
MEIDTLSLKNKVKPSIGFSGDFDSKKSSKIETIIDWFQCTIFPGKNDFESLKKFYENDYVYQDRIIPVLFKYLFNIDSINIIRDSVKLNGYDVVYVYNNIKIMLNSTRDDMGVNILLSGQACRDYEDLGFGTWKDLFDKISKFDININRIDIAIDSFTDKYFTLTKVFDYIINGNLSTKFRSTFEMKKRNLSNGKLLGDTIQFGSKASEVEITFYDKMLERVNAGRIISEDIKFWFRCELRFRHDLAEEIFRLIINDEDYSSRVKGILYNYIDFKNPYSKDKNITRRSTVKWWSEFIDYNNKFKIASKSSETSITKKYNWLLSSVSKSEMLVYFAKLNNFKLDSLSTDLLFNMLTRGLENVEDKDIMMINNERIKNKLDPVTKGEMLDYLQSLKDYLF